MGILCFTLISGLVHCFAWEDGLGLARWAGGGDIEIYNGMLERGSHNLALVGVLRGR